MEKGSGNQDPEGGLLKKGSGWAPWKRYEGDEEEDGELFEGVTDEERKGEKEKLKEKEGEEGGQEK
eukprot:2367447-Karenia_brevis.AAC.1